MAHEFGHNFGMSHDFAKKHGGDGTKKSTSMRCYEQSMHQGTMSGRTGSGRNAQSQILLKPIWKRNGETPVSKVSNPIQTFKTTKKSQK